MIKIMNEVDFSRFEDESNLGGKWHIELSGATLLSVDEYRELKEKIPYTNNFWWLRSPGRGKQNACGVDINRKLKTDFWVAAEHCYCVRPALIISNLNEWSVGEKFIFGGYSFIIISEQLAICYYCIDERCFREDYKSIDANDYEKSDIKDYVDAWFNKANNDYKGGTDYEGFLKRSK